MPNLSITNRTASRLPVNSFVGVLEPNEVRSVELLEQELELTKAKLVELAAASLILWSTTPTTTAADNQAEVVLGGARVLRGAGAPENNVLGSVGDLYVRSDGGALTTLYVKESGNATTTGWVAK
jgi:hypothetical protein